MNKAITSVLFSSLLLLAFPLNGGTTYTSTNAVSWYPWTIYGLRGLGVLLVLHAIYWGVLGNTDVTADVTMSMIMNSSIVTLELGSDDQCRSSSRRNDQSSNFLDYFKW